MSNSKKNKNRDSDKNEELDNNIEEILDDYDEDLDEFYGEGNSEEKEYEVLEDGVEQVFKFEDGKVIFIFYDDKIIFKQLLTNSSKNDYKEKIINKKDLVAVSYEEDANSKKHIIIFKTSNNSINCEFFSDKKSKEFKNFLTWIGKLRLVISKNNLEIRKKCNVCGKIFCYNQSDLRINNNQQIASGFAAIGSIASSVGGSRYDMYEMNKIANHANDKVIDYFRCPQCGSRDLSDYYKNDNKDTTKKNDIEIIEIIKKYKELLDMGAITKEEFEEKKIELLKK